MKLLHLADLHIGKRVNEFSMLEDQIYILHQILDIARERRPDGVLIAGDVYDKTIPLRGGGGHRAGRLPPLPGGPPYPSVCGAGQPTIPPKRLGLWQPSSAGKRVYIAAPYHGAVERFTLEDAYGPVGIHLLPLPAASGGGGPATRKKRWTATTAECAWPLSHADFFRVQTAMLLVAHQFVTSGGKGAGAQRFRSHYRGGTGQCGGLRLRPV